MPLSSAQVNKGQVIHGENDVHGMRKRYQQGLICKYESPISVKVLIAKEE